MTRALCGLPITTVRVCSPKGPTRDRLLLGSGVTVIELSITVWLADDRGVRRSTQRAKVTSSS